MRYLLVGNLGRAPLGQDPAAIKTSLEARGYRVEQSKAGGHLISRSDAAVYFRTDADLAGFARRIASDDKAISTMQARAALAGHRLEKEPAIDGRARYRLERADGRMHLAANLAEVDALLEVQQ